MLRQPQRRFAMDAILGQFLAFDLATQSGRDSRVSSRRDPGNPVV